MYLCKGRRPRNKSHKGFPSEFSMYTFPNTAAHLLSLCVFFYPLHMAIFSTILLIPLYSLWTLVNPLTPDFDYYVLTIFESVLWSEPSAT